jgi:transposase
VLRRPGSTTNQGVATDVDCLRSRAVSPLRRPLRKRHDRCRVCADRAIPAGGQGGPRATALREVVNAILYLVRTGCAWSMLPREFRSRSTVYGYFRRFGQEGGWHRIWMVLTMAARDQARKEAQPSDGIPDMPAAAPWALRARAAAARG